MAVPIDNVNQMRRLIGELLGVIQELKDADAEHIALGNDVILQDADFTDNNGDITKAEYLDGIGAWRAVETIFETNKTNLYQASNGEHRR